VQYPADKEVAVAAAPPPAILTSMLDSGRRAWQRLPVWIRTIVFSLICTLVMILLAVHGNLTDQPMTWWMALLVGAVYFWVCILFCCACWFFPWLWTVNYWGNFIILNLIAIWRH